MKTRKCSDFCKKDYVPYLYNKFYNKSSKHFLHAMPRSRKKNYMDLTNQVCKLTYCNPKCSGLSDQLKHLKRKNGFRTAYSKKRVTALKKRGALSGCMYDNEHTYDVFHKGQPNGKMV